MRKKTALFLFLAFGFFQNAFNPTFSHAVEVAFEKDPSLPLVDINVVIKAGAVTDPANESGLTNFMGEMLLKGTKRRSKEQVDLALDQIGAKLFVDVRTEALILRGSVLSSKLEPYLKLLTEILTEPSFPEKEIKHFKAEQISLIQEDLGHDTSLASRRFQKFLFLDHPYGNPVEGTVKGIEGLTRAKLEKHYHRIVQDNALLVVGSGAASSERISAWADQLAHLLPNKKLSPQDQILMAKVPKPKDQDHRRFLIIDKPDRTQTQIIAGQIGIRMTDKDFFPLYVGNYAFGGASFSSILMQEIRVKRGWSYGANSGFRHGLQPRSWSLHLFPAAKDTPAALAYSLRLIQDLKEKGITPEQFAFTRKSLINSSGFIYNTPKRRVENKLLERTLDLPEGFMKRFGEEIAKVNYSEVNTALSKFLKPEHMTVTVLGTAVELKEPIAKALKIPANEIQVTPYIAE